MVKAVKAGEAQAHARVYGQLPDRGIPVSLRDAQLVLAREYGYNGWTELKVEILKRSGNGLAWAAHEGVQAIHANDVERLRQLITEYPELLSWRDSDADGEVLSRGYDVTIKDHRFGSTAEGWARYGGHQEMVDLLAAATR